MAVRLAINGFGRIGRAAFKIALEQDDVELVAINDLGDIENLAYLLSFDTNYGRYAHPVRVEEGALIVGEKKIQVFSEKDPTKLPWKDLAVDVVIESTGVFTDEASASGHVKAGAKKVIISAPTDSENVKTVVLGANNEAMNDQVIISCASCTTNSVAPVVAILDREFGVNKAILTTVHAYTATQSLVDGPAKKDFRRGRSAGENIVPSSTGAAQAAALTVPALMGKFDGVSLRVPVSVVSISDITAVLKKAVTREEVNGAFERAAQEERFAGIVAVTDKPVVSSDFRGDTNSAIVDLEMTRVVDGDLVKVLVWYDNEWGYSQRLVEEVLAFGKA